MNDPVKIVFGSLNEKGFKSGTIGALHLNDQVRLALGALCEAGWRLVRPAETDPHYVVFKDDGWEIEHSAGCRNAGSMLECRLHRELTDFCDGPPPQGLGRYEAEELEHGWDIVPAPDAPVATALLFVEEWTP